MLHFGPVGIALAHPTHRQLVVLTVDGPPPFMSILLDGVMTVFGEISQIRVPIDGARLE